LQFDFQKRITGMKQLTKMRTTITIPEPLLIRVDEVGKRFNIRSSEIIASCLRRRIRKLCKSKYSFEQKAVLYQGKGLCEYLRFHVLFDWDEYHSNTLARFSRKFSVSYLAAQAIREYIDIIEMELIAKKSLSKYPAFVTRIDKFKIGKRQKKLLYQSLYRISQRSAPT